MYKSAIRAAPRLRASPRTAINNSRRFLSTAQPTPKSRSWKNSAARWALAAGGLYFYSTSDVFAEEQQEEAVHRPGESIPQIQESKHLTIDAIVEEKRQRRAEQMAEDRKRERMAERALLEGEGVEGEEGEEGEEGMGGLEEEAGQEGAFNPETGEINWDCPCLGGMAHGPCGEEFKAAFSCFVYSEEEPKGVECIERFKGMQDCFRQHPEMYGSELEDDDDEIEDEIRAREAEQSLQGEDSQPTEPKQSTEETPKEEPAPISSRSDELTPKPATDETPKTEPAPISSRSDELAPKPTTDVHQDSEKTEVVQHAGDEGGELVAKATSDATTK